MKSIKVLYFTNSDKENEITKVIRVFITSSLDDYIYVDQTIIEGKPTIKIRYDEIKLKPATLDAVRASIASHMKPINEVFNYIYSNYRYPADASIWRYVYNGLCPYIEEIED